MAQLSPSISPLQHNCYHLSVENFQFLVNGPYTFGIKRGECLGLSGRSGIGKTQLLRAITELIPYTGKVLLDGVCSTVFSAPAWRSRVTMIPAEPLWWYSMVGDHFSDRYSQPIKEKLGAVGFSEDVLNWQVSRLSTGEKQRLALIRGMCHLPSVLLLDEPCSSLDGYHTALVETFILKYRNNTNASVLWVSHDPEQFQRVADRVLYMEKDVLSV